MPGIEPGSETCRDRMTTSVVADLFSPVEPPSTKLSPGQFVFSAVCQRQIAYEPKRDARWLYHADITSHQRGAVSDAGPMKGRTLSSVCG